MFHVLIFANSFFMLGKNMCTKIFPHISGVYSMRIIHESLEIVFVYFWQQISFEGSCGFMKLFLVFQLTYALVCVETAGKSAFKRNKVIIHIALPFAIQIS